jgi:hypothetical protein
LLGNDLESMFMPVAIVFVEGTSDQKFVERLLAIHFPDKKITVVVGQGDGGIVNKVQTVRQAFGDLGSTPYHGKVFVLLDSKHSADTSQLVRIGVKPENIKVWTQNGIEYVYPAGIMTKIYGCDEAALEKMEVTDNSVKVAGETKAKVTLSDLVCRSLTRETALHPELRALLSQLAEATR